MLHLEFQNVELWSRYGSILHSLMIPCSSLGVEAQTMKFEQKLAQTKSII